ncbi:heterokaryon incompatibility protein-domain-containing protein [Diaporthe sp. PMI_573]|nr:heterokaryon incompatibility protein-domain-containing protein [Diaporthaceae sp. PMI_573]
MTTYTYTSIYGSQQTREIRVIDILPGNGDEELSCLIRHVSLFDDPQFDAISYCWGGQAPSRPILCDGLSQLITENLHDALRCFRSPDQVATLWADGICMNQKDNREKSDQVLLMRYIYSQAREVKVWLGSADNDVDVTEVVGSIAQLNRLAHYYSEKLSVPMDDLYDIRSQRWASAMDDMESELQQGPRLESLFNFLAHPWFSRMWIVQEVALAHGNAWVYYGGVRIRWSEIVDAFFFSVQCRKLMAAALVSDADKSQLMQGITALAKTAVTVKADSTGDGVGLFWLLHTNKSAMATDPRDKIYGVLGIANNTSINGTDPFITPDYDLDAAALYQQVSEKFLERFPKLSILSGAGMLAAGGSQIPGLPSWVVDWTDIATGSNDMPTDIDARLLSGMAAIHNASLADKYPKVYRVDGKILKLQGMVLDEIVACEDVFDISQLASRHKDLSMMQRGFLMITSFRQAAKIWQCAPGTIYPHTKEDSLDAFIKTLFMGNAPGSADLTTRREIIRKYLRIARMASFLEKSPIARSRHGLSFGVNALALVTAGVWQDEAIELFQLAMQSMANKSAFRTSREYMGVSFTRQVRVGDSVVLNRGGYNPHILRKRSDGLWTLVVGDSYIHGIMNGEAFDIDKCREVCIA